MAKNMVLTYLHFRILEFPLIEINVNRNPSSTTQGSHFLTSPLWLFPLLFHLCILSELWLLNFDSSNNIHIMNIPISRRFTREKPRRDLCGRVTAKLQHQRPTAGWSGIRAALESPSSWIFCGISMDLTSCNTQMLHDAGRFLYIWAIFWVNVGIYSSTMEHLGYVRIYIYAYIYIYIYYIHIYIYTYLCNDWYGFLWILDGSNITILGCLLASFH